MTSAPSSARSWGASRYLEEPMQRRRAWQSLCATVMLLQACGGSPADPQLPPLPESAPGTLALGFGPVTVPAGAEQAQCLDRRLNNATEVYVGAIENELIGQGSHHLI